MSNCTVPKRSSRIQYVIGLFVLTFLLSDLLSTDCEAQGRPLPEGLLSDNSPYTKKCALIIGNSDYSDTWGELSEVKQEVQAVSNRLKQIGFDIAVRENIPSRDSMLRVISRFISNNCQMKGTGMLFYFSGHLRSFHSTNYLVPINAPKFDSANLTTCLSLQELYRLVDRDAKGVLFKFFILNGCAPAVSGTGKPLTVPVVPKDKNPLSMQQTIFASDNLTSPKPSKEFYQEFIRHISDQSDLNSDLYLTSTEVYNAILESLLTSKANKPQVLLTNDREPQGDFILCRRLGNEGNIEVRSEINGRLSIDRLPPREISATHETLIPNVKAGGHSYHFESGGKQRDGSIMVQAGRNNQLFIRNTITIEQSNQYTYEMVLVPGGRYMMGSDNGKPEEGPKHEVVIDTFYIGKYEVTQRLWKSVMTNAPPNLFHRGCDECPVTDVCYEEVLAFIDSLNTRTGENYRLPTEGEWEYAAKGGQNVKDIFLYSGGNNAQEVGWLKTNATTTSVIGKKRSNQLGIFDMTGNVWEFCSDWFSLDYYKLKQKNNPRGPADSTVFKSKAIRGGSWDDDPGNATVTSRQAQRPTYKDKSVGFRLARSISGSIH